MDANDNWPKEEGGCKSVESTTLGGVADQAHQVGQARQVGLAQGLAHRAGSRPSPQHGSTQGSTCSGVRTCDFVLDCIYILELYEFTLTPNIIWFIYHLILN